MQNSEPHYPNVMPVPTRDDGPGIMRSANGGKTFLSIHGPKSNYHPGGFVYGIKRDKLSPVILCVFRLGKMLIQKK